MKRVITSLILIPVVAYAVLLAPWWVFMAVVYLVAALCWREYARITDAFTPFGYLAGALVLIAPPRETMMLFVLISIAAMAMGLAATDLARGFQRAAALALGILYIFGGWKTAVLLHDIDRPAVPHLSAGVHWLAFGLVVSWVGDTGAYYVGRAIGKHKLAPHVSPGKTWEGAIASVFASMLFGLAYLPWAIPGTPYWIAALFAVIANIAGQLGDLAESALKRGAGVKDSGTLLPGHGGALDRVDSSMFALPVLFVLVNLLNGN